MKKLIILIVFLFINTSYGQQFSRPISDLDNTGGWTIAPLWSVLDDDVLTKVWTDPFIINDGSPNASEPFTLDGSTVTDPVSATGHIIRCFAAKVSGGANTEMVIELRQGYISEASQGTLIGTLNTGNLPTPAAATSFSYTLSSGEANSITDYADLQFRCFAQKLAGGANRQVDCWAVELELPDASAAPPRRIFIIN